MSSNGFDEPNSARAYGPEVKSRIRQREPESYRSAALLLNESNVDVVNLQHEFGLYGVWKDGVYEDHLRPFLLELRKPLMVTLHSVPPSPSHLAGLIQKMRTRGVRIVVREPHEPERDAAFVAVKAGASVVVLATSVGALPNTDDYLSLFEANVATLIDAVVAR